LKPLVFALHGQDKLSAALAVLLGGETGHLTSASFARLVTLNTIPHPSNAIDLSEQIAPAITTPQA